MEPGVCLRIFFYLAPPELWINIHQIFYYYNAPQGHSKNRVFQNTIFDIGYSKESPKKVPKPHNYRRCKLFIIRDSLGVRNAVLLKDKPRKITKGSRNTKPKYPLYYQQPPRAVSTRNKCRRMGNPRKKITHLLW